eukprot:10255-Heterococcus_DN1.PRE.2
MRASAAATQQQGVKANSAELCKLHYYLQCIQLTVTANSTRCNFAHVLCGALLPITGQVRPSITSTPVYAAEQPMRCWQVTQPSASAAVAGCDSAGANSTVAKAEALWCLVCNAAHTKTITLNCIASTLLCLCLFYRRHHEHT